VQGIELVNDKQSRILEAIEKESEELAALSGEDLPRERTGANGQRKPM
jgi:hypothetical protein